MTFCLWIPDKRPQEPFKQKKRKIYYKIIDFYYSPYLVLFSVLGLILGIIGITERISSKQVIILKTTYNVNCTIKKSIIFICLLFQVFRLNFNNLAIDPHFFFIYV